MRPPSKMAITHVSALLGLRWIAWRDVTTFGQLGGNPAKGLGEADLLNHEIAGETVCRLDDDRAMRRSLARLSG